MDGIDLNYSRSMDTSSLKNQDDDTVVERINQELEKLKEKLTKISSRCHMLQVDLATQFSPYIVETLRNAKEDCKNCTTKIQLHLNANS